MELSPSLSSASCPPSSSSLLSSLLPSALPLLSAVTPLSLPHAHPSEIAPETPSLPASASPASPWHSFTPSFSSYPTLEELVDPAAEKEKAAAHKETMRPAEKEEKADTAAGQKQKRRTEDAADDSGIKSIIKKLESRFLKEGTVRDSFLRKDFGSYRPLPLRGYGLPPAGQLFTAGSSDALKGFYGGSNIKTDMYKEFYEEGATKLGQRYAQESKYSDIGYRDVMGIVWTNVKNKTFSSSAEFAGTEQVAAHLKEKWSVLKIFPTYQVMAMLNYQTALT